METLTVTKNVKQYGFEKGDVLTVKRNIRNECVVIIPDDNEPNIIMSEEAVKTFGVLSGEPQIHFH